MSCYYAQDEGSINIGIDNNNGYYNVIYNTNYTSYYNDNNNNNNNEYFNNDEQEEYNKFIQHNNNNNDHKYDEDEEMEDEEEDEHDDEEQEQENERINARYYSHPEFGPIQPPFDHDPLHPPAPLDFDDIKNNYNNNDQLFILNFDGFWNIITLSNIDVNGFYIDYTDGKKYFIDAHSSIFPVFYPMPSDFNLPKINQLSLNNTQSNNNNNNSNEESMKSLIGKELLIEIPGKGITPMIYSSYDKNNGRSSLKEKDGNIVQMYLNTFNYQISN
jgi:hypothetical protein